MKIPESKIALILYTLRDFCSTYEDLDETFKKIKTIGYQAVQVSGVAVDPEGVKELLEKHNLYVCGTHESKEECLDDFDAVLQRHKLWGSNFAALGHPGDGVFTPEGLDEIVPQLMEIGAKFNAAGIKFAYHNHHHEFAKFNGKTWLEALYERIPPNILYAELDLHWVARGGATPVNWINKVAGRMPVVHVKDFVIVNSEPQFCEVGEGNIEWSEIIKTCEATGVRWYVVEQDQPFGERDIFESIELSYKNLQAMGIK
jgi:sugar phosphate isomerase/epimerase